MDIFSALEEKPFLLLDGAMGTALEDLGLSLDHLLWSGKALFTNPGLVKKVHEAYIQAGADILVTNSYQISSPGFQQLGYSHKDLAQKLLLSAQLADQAREQTSRAVWIAGGMGPYGAYLADGSEFTGTYQVDREELYQFHFSRLAIMEKTAIDLIGFETIPSIKEAHVILQILETLNLPPSWISFSCKDEKHISDGTPIKEVAAWLESQSVIDFVGVNCLAPKMSIEALKEMRKKTSKPFIVYPNRGEVWDFENRCWIPDSGTTNFLPLVSAWLQLDVKIIGGCCRTTPAMIQALYNHRNLL